MERSAAWAEPGRGLGVAGAGLDCRAHFLWRWRPGGSTSVVICSGPRRCRRRLTSPSTSARPLPRPRPDRLLSPLPAVRRPPRMGCVPGAAAWSR